MIIKELAEEFRAEIQCIPEDKEKYKSFSIPIMYKECNNYKMPYNLRFINSNRFMMRTLESHVNNISQLYHCKCSNKIKQEIRTKHSDKNIYTKCKTCTERSKQSIDSLKLKFPHINYQMEILRGSYYCLKEVFILTNTWMIGRSLMKQRYLQ